MMMMMMMMTLLSLFVASNECVCVRVVYTAVAPCYPGEYRCWPDQCLSSCVVCDGFPDCENDKDEDPQFCGKVRL